MNARFWTIINGSPVKITLQPHETLRHTRGGPTEEGYSYSGNEWYWDERVVHVLNWSKARGCDGPLETYCEQWINPCDLKHHTSEFVEDPEVMFPRYQTMDCCQYDAFAAAAGY